MLWYRRAAEQGFAPAQLGLGWAYLNGDGVPRNAIEATKWFRKAAIQGLPKAEFRLGVAYLKGLGVSRNHDKALRWFRRAGLHGELDAAWFVAYVYQIGDGVPQNFAEAAKWYRIGAERGDAPCQGGLGVLYADGRGVPKDYVLAYMWLNLSVANSDRQLPNLRNTNSKLAGLLDSIAARMTPEQIADAQKLAREWKPKSKQGDSKANEAPLKVGHSAGKIGSQIRVPLKEDGGVLAVPVVLNGTVKLDFTVDSGAADVSIPYDVFSTLRRTGTIRSTDLLASRTYLLADGSRSKSLRFRIKSLKIGGVVIHDVSASVSNNHGLLLLGQSFLQRFKSWSIDNNRHELDLEVR